MVGYLRTTYPISERRACRTVRCARATYHDRSHRDPRTALRQRIREMAQRRGAGTATGRFGCCSIAKAGPWARNSSNASTGKKA